MDIEITNAYITKDKTVVIEGIDVSEENLRRMERFRDDAQEQELRFEFDTLKEKVFLSFRSWLKSQKATKGSATYGEALSAVIGTITTIPRKYRVLEY